MIAFGSPWPSLCPLPSGPRRGVTAPGRGLAPSPPPNREDETMQHTVDQAPGAMPPSPASSRTRAGHVWPRAPIWARGMGPLHRRGRPGTGQLRAADSLFHAGIHPEDIDQARRAPARAVPGLAAAVFMAAQAAPAGGLGETTSHVIG